MILDVAALLRWSGPATGIVRAEHALAQAVLRRPGARLACFDREMGAWRALAPAWQDTLLGWSGVLDTHRPQPSAPGWRRVVPNRQGTVAALERVRLTRPLLSGPAGLLQRALLAPRRHQFPLHDHDGRRIANVPRDLGLGPRIDPARNETVLSAGSGWFDGDPAREAALRRQFGFRRAVLCYDLIPVTHPHFYQPDVAAMFAGYWRAALPGIDTAIVTAACIAADLRRFCAAEGIAAPAVVQRPLGFDPPAPIPAASLPAGLQPGRFALFVSTIEPRKGHAMLLRAWACLQSQGLPEGFRLVFAGRPGWMVDGVLAQLRQPGDGSVVHLAQAGDATLEALYAAAAFCLYPSAYEGFGLPVIEAFARGKPVLASSGGAVAEVAGALAPCLDPADDAAWAAAMHRWITDEAALEAASTRVRAGFHHPGWDAAADAILDAAEG